MSLGLCSMHYSRQRSGKDMDAPPQKKRRNYKCRYPKCNLLAAENDSYCAGHRRRRDNNLDMDAPWGTEQPKCPDIKYLRCAIFDCGRKAVEYTGVCAIHGERLAKGEALSNDLDKRECRCTGCTEQAYDRGYCTSHLEIIERQQLELTCSVGWCERTANDESGMCTTHERLRRAA